MGNATCKQICIIGIGNPMRADDGVGAFVCEILGEKKIDGLTCIIKHQLDFGITEELISFDEVIFIDASIETTSISLQELKGEDNCSPSFSHHLQASMVAKLAKELFDTHTRFYICSVGSNRFGMGAAISAKARHNAHAAVSLLTDWIKARD
jgi:hydrogenase maturation protease